VTATEIAEISTNLLFKKTIEVALKKMEVRTTKFIFPSKNTYAKNIADASRSLRFSARLISRGTSELLVLALCFLTNMIEHRRMTMIEKNAGTIPGAPYLPYSVALGILNAPIKKKIPRVMKTKAEILSFIVGPPKRCPPERAPELH